MSAFTTKVIYFTAGAVPTAAEKAAISRLATTRPNKVFVRNGAVNADTTFSGNLEACDFVAGTVPTAYNGKTVITVPGAGNADLFKVFPATVQLDLSNVDVQKLSAVAVVIDPNTGLATATDKATDAAWTTSDAGKATVGAATGIVTATGTGSVTITAKYTADGGTEVSSTCAVTVVA